MMLNRRLGLASLYILLAIMAVCFGYRGLMWIGVIKAPLASLMDRNLPPLSMSSEGHFFVLGSDPLGRDLLARIIEGGTVSLTVGILAIVFAGAIGIILGILAGYRGGATDLVIMRIVDIQMSFPGILVALLVIYALGPSIFNVIVVLALAQWPLVCRTARSLTLSIREREFVDAARLAGFPNFSIIMREILPNVLPATSIILAVEFSAVMIAEAGLSFIGFGVQPPSTSWGLLLSQGREYMTSAPWLVIYPGLFLAITAICVNLYAAYLRSYRKPTVVQEDVAFPRTSAIPHDLNNQQSK
jgi:peptide/nickel transport system permease protein